MPKPNPGESKSKYISRAIEYFMDEGYSQKEAAGRAYGFWKTYGGKGKYKDVKKKK